MMKNRLLIISDLWGNERAAWMEYYMPPLSAYFEVVFYDACKLGEVDTSIYTEENLHSQFVKGGIEQAVNKLVELEKNPVYILAFSIGGTIAWQFGLKGGRIEMLFCISATRLRKEVVKPKGRISLWFGSNDTYRPSIEWQTRMDQKCIEFSERNHDFYTDAMLANQAVKELVNQLDESKL
tara:strand:+ start:45394 stop:45936 length:543 start_codon:yes stop_codon:yes gene_type:complete